MTCTGRNDFFWILGHQSVFFSFLFWLQEKAGRRFFLVQPIAMRLLRNRAPRRSRVPLRARSGVVDW
jgi:hypothetical protein